MNNAELYINGALCDISGDLNIRLNRQLISPGELNSKDAQYSYSITLPSTAANNAILNYANVEETGNKFNRIYTAEIVVGGVRLSGYYFRLSNISPATGYKGNLYTPTLKSIKDIFGDIKLNQNPEFRIPFVDFAAYVTYYNNLAVSSPQPAIFPYVLYGVLPKVAQPDGSYTPRTVWDSSVRLGIQDVPPSINTLQMLKHIFNSQGYKLSGSAFNDPRLTSLYMSYQNDVEYVQPWNYGQHSRVHLTGRWGSLLNQRVGGINPERKVNEIDAGAILYAVDLFDANNTNLNVIEDPGANVLSRLITDPDGRTSLSAQVRIPTAGFYKVQLDCSLAIDNTDIYPILDSEIQRISGHSDFNNSDFTHNIYEMRLVRDRGKADFNIADQRINGTFFDDNLPQNTTFDADNIPKYFPKAPNDAQINMIDAKQDVNHVLGFGFGILGLGDVAHINPLETADYAQIQAAKPAQSYDLVNTEGVYTKLAINSTGYSKYDRIDGGSTLGYRDTDRYKIQLDGAPANYAQRGRFNNSAAPDTVYYGQGHAAAVVWFEAGEMVSLLSVSTQGTWHNAFIDPFYGWVNQEMQFDLLIEPYRAESEWLKIDEAGTGTAPMNWNDPVTFDTDNIDLVKFLSATVKTDDFIDNFCKAYNLKLSQIVPGAFTLDVKQAKRAVSNRFIDMDGKASILDRSNTPVNLPSSYVIGFTVNKDEEGYVTTQDDGGGQYDTGVIGGTIVTQTSFFSYNWFKNITKGLDTLALPAISLHEAYDLTLAYVDAMLKRDTNLAQRFWYFDGALPGSYDFNGAPMVLAKVSNELANQSVLNYKNAKNSILNNYFTIIISPASHYTELAAYLTPAEYQAMNGSIKIKFNGDLYYIAELNAYDPTNNNQTTLKLIRKI